jgi:hypothetical protein
MMKGFPFQYLGEMVFYRPNEMDEKSLPEKIWSALEVVPDNHQQVNLGKGPFFFASTVQIDIKVDPIVVHIIYRIHLAALNLSLLIGILLCMYIGVMGYPASAWWLLFLVITGYVIALILQNNYLQKKISIALNLPPFEGEAALWHKQKQWMQQPDRCPACGELRNIYSDKCVSCGLKLPHLNNLKSIESNATSTNNQLFTYEYKK